MKYHVLYTSDYAMNILKTHDTSGVVHSVYHKTINIHIGDKMLAIQAEGSPLSPISLITDMSPEIMEHLPITAGCYLKLDPNTILIDAAKPDHFHHCHQSSDIPACQISLQSAASVDLHLSSFLSEKKLCGLTQKILPAICHADRKGFRLLFLNTGDTTDAAAVQEDPVLTVADMRLKKASRLLRAEHIQEAAQELVRLIGLGIGLTPSGDDFLTGILAGLILCHKQKHPFTIQIRHQIQSHLTDTNDISGAFLICALEGQFSKTINTLPHMPDSESILHAFLQIGHSSGIDTLCGIYYILSLLPYIR